MIIDSQCLKCKRFRNKDKTGNNCDAFPEGIPKKLWFNEQSHTLPFKDDKGLLFDPIKGIG